MPKQMKIHRCDYMWVGQVDHALQPASISCKDAQHFVWGAIAVWWFVAGKGLLDRKKALEEFEN